MGLASIGNVLNPKPTLRPVLTIILVLGVTLFVGALALTDFAVPLVEINNKVGNVAEIHGYVVALGHNVEDCKYYLVLVTNDRMEHIVISATADKNVVKESLLGRPVIIKAQVTDRKEDPKTKRVVVKLKILSIRSSKKQKSFKKIKGLAQSEYERGKADALKDLKANRPRYLQIGRPLSLDSKFSEILKDEYDIKFVGLGCAVVPRVAEHARGYNEVVVNEMKRRFGKDVIEAAWQKDREQRRKGTKESTKKAMNADK